MSDFQELKDKYHYDAATPMMQQYFDVKFAHMDALVLFRMGDFYELFLEDAVTASQVLGIALSKRGKNGESDIHMCGVPHHALESYLHKLVDEGYKVAICDQLESPIEAKKRGYKAIVKRGVVRIITQGTITEESIINTANPNYLVSVVIIKDSCALSYLDLSTSEFGVLEVHLQDLSGELARLSPKEILISDKIQSDSQLHEIFAPYRARIVYQVDSYFAVSKCQKAIESFYNIITTESFGALSDLQISAVGAVLEYIRITQKNNLPDLPFPELLDLSQMMIIDSSTRRNLEIISNLSGGYKNSLLSSINYTITKQGSRLLYQYLSSPIASKDKIDYRLNITEFFYNNEDLCSKIRGLLKTTGDIERLLSRIALNRASPRDLLAIKHSLLTAEQIKTQFELNLPEYIYHIVRFLAFDEKLLQLIEDAVKDDVPNQISDGGFIKTSYHPKLEELYNLIDNSSSIIASLKSEYQQETGIDNLRICHNNILGLFIEITPKNAPKITDAKFIHRQSIATAVRYTTTRLQELESQMSNAKTLAINLEHEIFSKICAHIVSESENLRKLANGISQLDLYTSLAFLAHEHNYTKPEMTDDTSLIIRGGRHPVVERNMSYRQSFTPNDCDLSEDQRLWLITGPNMAGKSTFLRQNALIVLLAQMGSFVPATYAKIGVVDKLFSRIGAADDLSRGQSTFMVEMIETSAILAQSTEKSLIVLDEVGRGTSTYDGLSIAWGCLEHIHDKLRCRSLFATHYHELTILRASLHSLRNYTIKINETAGKILFLHQIIPGSADRSYGIHVAELAGLPRAVIKRSKEILQKLEKSANKQNEHLHNNYSLFEAVTNAEDNNKPNPALELLELIDPNDLSPKEALEKLYELKKALE
jgi:DNA mismatch repair protein MutS